MITIYHLSVIGGMGYPFDIVIPAEAVVKVAPQQKEIEWDAVRAMLGQASRGHMNGKQKNYEFSLWHLRRSLKA